MVARWPEKRPAWLLVIGWYEKFPKFSRGKLLQSNSSSCPFLSTSTFPDRRFILFLFSSLFVIILSPRPLQNFIWTTQRFNDDDHQSSFIDDNDDHRPIQDSRQGKVTTQDLFQAYSAVDHEFQPGRIVLGPLQHQADQPGPGHERPQVTVRSGYWLPATNVQMLLYGCFLFACLGRVVWSAAVGRSRTIICKFVLSLSTLYFSVLPR